MRASISDPVAAQPHRAGLGLRIRDAGRRLLAPAGAGTAATVAGIAFTVTSAQLIFFALFQPIWSPIDEQNHFFYVNYLYYAHRPPMAGLAYTIAPHAIGPASTTIISSRSAGVQTGPRGFEGEGIQPPLYYALMAPPFASAPHGSYDQVIRVRLATAALAAILIPLTFVLARLAAPASPWVWGAASVVPAVSRGYVYNMSQVTNDALAVVVGSAALLSFLWLARARIDWRWGLVAGLTAGVAVLTKVTVYFVPLVLAALFLIRVLRARGRVAWPAAVGTGLLTSLLPAAPWLALSFHRYHGLMPKADPSTIPAILLPFIGQPPLQWVRLVVEQGSIKFWTGEAPFFPQEWLLLLGQLGLVLCLLGFAGRLVWRARPLPPAALIFLWTGAGLACLLFIVYLSGVAVLTGRYVYPLFSGIAICCAVGANRLGAYGRWLFIGSVGALLVTSLLVLGPTIGWVTSS